MLKSLMVGLTEKDMQAVINSFNLNPWYHNTIFPIKQNFTLTWKSLEAQTGLHIAGDVVARGASVLAKSREALSRIQGDIPKISTKRVKDENELNEYNIMLALTANDQNQRALVEAWAEDMQFVWDGNGNRVEWLSLRQISMGKISLTESNNVGLVTTNDIDYGLSSIGHLLGFQTGSASWATTASAKPITVDFRATVARAKAAGISLKYAFMSLDTFAKFCDITEVRQLCAGALVNALNLPTVPTLEQVNTTLAGLAYLNGLQIVVIDQNITIEKADGSRVSSNPFAVDNVMFSESNVLGNTFYCTPADMSTQSVAMRVMNGYTCIKKFSTEEPLSEVTMGVANVFPGWTNSQRCYIMDTTHSSWSY